MKKTVLVLFAIFFFGFASLSLAVDYLKFYERISSIGSESDAASKEAASEEKEPASEKDSSLGPKEKEAEAGTEVSVSEIGAELRLNRVEISFEIEGSFEEAQKKLQSEFGVSISPPIQTERLHVAVKGFTMDEVVEKVCRAYDVNCVKLGEKLWRARLTESQVFFVESDFEGKRAQFVADQIRGLLSNRGRIAVLDQSKIYVEDTPSNMERIRRLFSILGSESLYCFNVKLIEVAYRSKSGSSFGWGSIISTMGAKVLVGTATGLPTPGLVFAIGSDSFATFMTLLKKKGQVRTVKEWSLTGPAEKPLFFKDGAVVDIGQEIATASEETVVKTRKFRPIGFEIQILPHIKEESLLIADVRVKMSQIGPKVKVQKKESFSVFEKEFQTKAPLALGKPVVVVGFRGAAHSSKNKGVPKLQDLKYVSTAFAKKGRSDLEVEYALIIEAKRISLDSSESLSKNKDFLFSTEAFSK